MKRNGRALISRLTVLLLAVLLIPAFACIVFAEPVANVSEAVCYEHGDVNGDGVVDSRDAIHVLYYSAQVPGSDKQTQVNQDCDFNGDGVVTAQDAIYVLYSSFHMVDSFTLDGMIHEYKEPLWNWEDDGSVTVEFVCGCGETVSFTQEDGVTVETQTTEATCTTAGQTVYSASVTFEEQEYTSEHIVVIDAEGHKMVGEQTCTTASSCENCDLVLAALGHEWEETGRTEATCVNPETRTYKCKRCPETDTKVLEGLERHAFQYVKDVQVDGCKWAKQYECDNCDATETGETFYVHTYTATLTEEATCSKAGVKTFTCGDCGDSYTEEVEKNDSHAWDKGVLDEATGVTTYTCADCKATKTAVLAEGNTATVSKENLQTSELQLNDAAIKLDEQTLAGLGEQVQIDVNVTDTENIDVALGTEEKAQIGTNPIYNFDMYSNEEQVSKFDGKITISLPYEIQTGDDVDCIDVWFINDDGEVECVQGTYSNGFVTFTTDHFSYYTVTRLTPKQRCAHYGHVLHESYKAATCTSNGHDIATCKRCGDAGEAEKNKVLPMLQHDYEETVVAATCTAPGSYKKVCSLCKKEISGELPALGHTWVLDEEASQEETCTEGGWKVYVCSNDGCNESYRDELPAKGHNFEDTETVAPDCNNHGYKKQTCSNCGAEQEVDKKAPTGHDYKAENAIWEWAEDYSEATVTLVCSYDENHTKELTAVVSRQLGAEGTCSAKITYKAVASFNKAVFEDTQEVDTGKVQHQPGATWQSNSGTHYHICGVCGERVDAVEHVFVEVSKTEPTCGATGRVVDKCTVCGYVRETVLNPVGEHTYVKGVCTVCGHEADDCQHMKLHRITEIDLSEYDLCGDAQMFYISCDCGKEFVLNFNNECRFGEAEDAFLETDVGSYYASRYECIDCGLVMFNGWKPYVDKETCYGGEGDFYAFVMDGETIAEGYTYKMPAEEHYLSIPFEEINLADYGLCGGGIDGWTCYCGEREHHMQQGIKCDFVYNEALSSDNESVYVCAECGAILRETYSVVEQPCVAVERVTRSYELNGKEVFGYTNTYRWQMHNSVIESELLGATCEDGVIVTETCKRCDYVYTYYMDYCEPIFRENTQFKNADYCCDGFYRESCACGNYQDFGVFGGSCDLETVSVSEDGRSEMAQCSICNLLWSSRTTESEKDADCRVDCEEKLALFDATNGNKVAEGMRVWQSEDHDLNITYTFLEGALDCTGGVKVTEVCKDCGYYYSGTRNDHTMEFVETYQLADYGLCGGTVKLFECFCGHAGINTYNEDICNWNYEEGGDDYDVYWCPQCNVYRKVQDQDEKIGQCLYRRTVTYTYYNDDGVLLEFSYSYNTAKHREVAEITQFGETCDDGYSVVKVCLDCGNRDNWGDFYGSHSWWDMERTIVTNGELCGEIELVEKSCACGQRNDTEVKWLDGKCELELIEQVDDVTYFRCATCGAELEQRFRNERVPDSCVVRWVNEYIWYRDGEEILRYETANESREHECLHTFELLGDTCDDGYYVTENCMYCDYSWTSEEPEYGCCAYQTANEQVYDGTGLCGPIYKEIQSCACGDFYEEYLSGQCEWEWTDYDEETGITYSTCNVCGAQREYQEFLAQGETVCEKVGTVEYRYFKDGEALTTLTFDVVTYDHEQLHTFNLWGDTCEEGYDVTATCMHCGDVETWKVYEGDHGYYLTDVIDLSEYGTCGGEIRVNSCPCEKFSDWQYETENCESYEVSVDPETGWEIGHCTECGIDRYKYYGTQYDRASCTRDSVKNVKFVRDGETVLELSAADKEEFHAWEMESITFESEDGAIEYGYNVNLVCDTCGAKETAWSNGHTMYGKEVFWMEDLTKDACGGFITIDQCGCGDEQGFSWYLPCSLSEEYFSEEDENGVMHNGTIYTCDTCGLEMVIDYFDGEVDAENCTGVHYGVCTLKMNDVVVKELTVESAVEIHTWGDLVYSLEEGKTNCYEGVRVDMTCEICGKQGWGEVNEHVLVPDADFEPINLQDYGAVCQTTIQKMVCPCGEQCEFVLAGENRCDMDWVEVDRYENEEDIWIEDYIKEGQHTADGWQYPESQFWNVTCAVTDPQCGYKLRAAEYWQWVEGTCLAKQYQTWDLYSTNENGEEEIAQTITLATGKQQTWHPYEHEVTVTEDEGTNTWQEIEADVCPLCGSSYTETRTYLMVPDEDGDIGGEQIAYEEVAINLLNNGETKRYAYGYEQDFKYNDRRYITYSHQETIYADDTEYWYWERCFDFDFTDGCKCRREYRNSNDIVHDDTIDAHITDWELATIKQNTCTQFGIVADQWYCVVCGQIVELGEPYEVEPTAHTWWYDDENGCYKCHDCDLQNVNGSSGSIVLEDMTEEYGNGENYVVGYWNRGNVDAIQYVSILLAEVPEGADDEVLLDVEITELSAETDDITAVSFSMAEVQAAAEEAGYTDGYEVRFTFVPVDAEDTLDYAITFGDLAA